MNTAKTISFHPLHLLHSHTTSRGENQTWYL